MFDQIEWDKHQIATASKQIQNIIIIGQLVALPFNLLQLIKTNTQLNFIPSRQDWSWPYHYLKPSYMLTPCLSPTGFSTDYGLSITLPPLTSIYHARPFVLGYFDLVLWEDIPNWLRYNTFD